LKDTVIKVDSLVSSNPNITAQAMLGGKQSPLLRAMEEGIGKEKEGN
jgi:hypothetical protein